jgi:hypothetical protein
VPSRAWSEIYCADQEAAREEGQQQADHDVRVELIVLNGPAKLPVPLAKRNPLIDFAVEQQER